NWSRRYSLSTHWGEREGPAKREGEVGMGEDSGIPHLTPTLSVPRGREGEKPLAVYIHWPFCRSKCPYCDFNSHVREGIDWARWTRALLADLEHQAALAPDRAVASIFFGGGTPSLMMPETVAALVARVRALWPVAADLEVSLEANPNSAEAERFAG